MPATAGFSYGRRDKHADLSKLFPCLTVFTKFFSSNRNSVHGVVLSSDPLEYFAIGRILVIMSILRCFASSDRYNKLKSLYSSALADFFYVNTFELFCCLLLRST